MPYPADRPNKDYLSNGQRVKTKDGLGTIIGYELRKNTNGGPGTWQYRIKLDDGRIRHYSKKETNAQTHQWNQYNVKLSRI